MRFSDTNKSVIHSVEKEPRICASLGLRVKFKTLFMSDKEKHDLPLFFSLSKQFLAPGGLSAECVQVRAM